MIKTIKKIGNSHGIILDKAYLDILGVKEGSQVNITTSGKSLIVTPEDNFVDDETFDQVASEIFERYDNAFRRLAE